MELLSELQGERAALKSEYRSLRSRSDALSALQLRLRGAAADMAQLGGGRGGAGAAAAAAPRKVRRSLPNLHILKQVWG